MRLLLLRLWLWLLSWRHPRRFMQGGIIPKSGRMPDPWYHDCHPGISPEMHERGRRFLKEFNRTGRVPEDL